MDDVLYKLIKCIKDQNSFWGAGFKTEFHCIALAVLELTL